MAIEDRLDRAVRFGGSIVCALGLYYLWKWLSGFRLVHVTHRHPLIDRIVPAARSDPHGGGMGPSSFFGVAAVPAGMVPENVDFEEMSPGEFVRWFFDETGFRITSDFVKTVSKRCDANEIIPTEVAMLDEITEGASGVSNSREAEGIADVYWTLADRYLDANPDVEAGSFDD